MSLTSQILEPSHSVPIVRDVDVVIAGAGISGLFAALAAGAHGARTILVERTASLGGNIGGSGFWMAFPDKMRSPAGGLGTLLGIGTELDKRVNEVLGDMPRNSSTISLAISRVALDLLEENNAEVILSAFASAPIMEGNRACGLFVETKSGRIAIRAKVVIDATGDADIAARAGAPIIWPVPVSECDDPYVWEFVKMPEYVGWNDGGMPFFVAGVDWPRFQAFVKSDVELSAADIAWREKTFLRTDGRMWMEGGKVHYTGKVAAGLYPLFRAASESGEHQTIVNLRPDVHVYPCHWWHRDEGDGVISSRLQISGYFDMSDWKDVSLAEAACRKCAFDMVRFYHRHVPGWEKAWMIAEPAFLGTRGGRCIEGDHTLTCKESLRGYLAPDVLFAVGPGARGEHRRREGHDIPYGMLLPKGIEGMLVAGRGAAYIRRGHDPDVRARGTLMRLGHATGTIAAMAASASVLPRQLGIKAIQKALLAEGFKLGDDARLKELGLA
jgi:hypothetical protein